MAFNDPIAELLTKLRNAKSARHRYVDIPLSRMKLNMIKLLKQQGYLEGFLVNEEKQKMRVFIKYAKDRKPVMQNLKRISSPGRRKYVKCHEIPQVLGGLGIAILSTPKGIIDDQTARNLKVGGELLCTVW